MEQFKQTWYYQKSYGNYPKAGLDIKCYAEGMYVGAFFNNFST